MGIFVSPMRATSDDWSRRYSLGTALHTGSFCVLRTGTGLFSAVSETEPKWGMWHLPSEHLSET